MIQHHRRSIRLPGYDYTGAGWYFVTFNTKGRAPLFGALADGRVGLSEAGRILEACWQDLPNHYPHVMLDEYIIMPDHFHGIIVLTDGDSDSVGAGFKPAPTESENTYTENENGSPSVTKRHGLPEIVRALKTFSARRINEARGTPGIPIWQRNYYEHIIRDEDAYQRIGAYIRENPSVSHEEVVHA